MSRVTAVSNLTLKGSLTFGTNLTDFPLSPQVGEIVLRDGVLWTFTTISGVLAWYPLTNKKNSYVHVQGAVSTQWTVQHNLNSSDLIIAVYDASGNVTYPGTHITNLSEVSLFFAEATSGTCVVIAESDINAPQVAAQQISAVTVKIGNLVITDNNGSLFINGSPIDSNAPVNSVNGHQGDVVLIANDISGISTVGKTGDYADLTNKPTAVSLNAIPTSQKGVANGVATLDEGGLIPAVQLPSYVDDVLEYANLVSFPATGETGKIYLALDTSKPYRWTGSVYLEITASPGSTDAVAEGSVNLYFTDARAQTAVTSVTGNAGTATKLATTKNIAGVAFDGSADINIPFSNLSSKPTTLAGYGITDGAPVSSVNAKTGAVVLTQADIGMAGNPYDIYGSTFGVPAANDNLVRFLSARAFTIPANFEGSIAKVNTAATTSTVYSVQKNGTQVATITFAAGGTIGTFSSQAAISLAVGDKFSIVGPASPDATLADVDVAIPAVLN